MKKILFIFLLLPSICFGQVVKTGVVVQNGGTQQGRATTVNCDGTTMTCAMSGSTVTLTSSGGVSGWTVSGNNVYETSSGNVGIGTSTVTGGALVITNGNVGIGTWVPTAPLSVGANAFTVNSAGSITAVTGITTTGAYTQSGTGINYFTGNVGIGSNAPNSSLDVEGTLSTATFGGNVGVGTFSPQYKLIVAGAGNVGIGTSNVSGALISLGGACSTEENISLCIGKGSTGIACVGYCTGSLGTCSACTCC